MAKKKGFGDFACEDGSENSESAVGSQLEEVAQEIDYLALGPRKRTNKRLGWRRDLPDPRDLHFKRTKTMPVVDKAFSLRSEFQPNYDQGQYGSCQSETGRGVDEFIRRHDRIKGNEFSGSTFFLYYNVRVIEGTGAGNDAGGTLRDVIKALATWGICPEELWPYTAQDFASKPSNDCYANALKHKAIKYCRVQQNVQAIKSALHMGYPVMFGCAVFDQFESDECAQSGIVQLPGIMDESIGGHAMIIQGWDMNKVGAKPYFDIRNSYGGSWGDKGNCWMPFDYVLSPDLAADFWIIEEVDK